jgi:hypothetical protein
MDEFRLLQNVLTRRDAITALLTKVEGPLSRHAK